MKKTNFRLLMAILSIAGLLVFGLTSFKSQKNEEFKTTSPLQSACNGKPPGWFDGTTFTSLSTDFVSHNFSAYVVGDSAYFYQMNICYVNSATPPWYTYQYIGVLNSSLRPSATRTFTGTWTGVPSQTVQFTLYSTGALYMQQTGGAVMGRAAQIMSNKYKL